MATLRRQGVRLWADEDGQLRYKAPKGVMNPALLAELRACKSDILGILGDAGADVADEAIPAGPADRREAPLSFSQQRLWFLQQLEGPSPVYNIAHAVRLTGRLNKASLQRSFDTLLSRHAILRTAFVSVAGEAVQRIAPQLTLEWVEDDLSDRPAGERERRVQERCAELAGASFDFGQAPLLNARLLRLREAEHVLILVLHHMIADGWSLGVLIREFCTLYRAYAAGDPAILPALPIQYADFVDWQRTRLRGDLLQSQLAFWRRQLAAAPLVLDLPTDRPRPPMLTYRGATEVFHIAPDLTQAVYALARQSGASLFMVGLAAFGVLLGRYGGQRDLLIGAPVANRNRRELEPLIGFFVNTLAMRVDWRDDPPFTVLLERVRRMALMAYEHQDTPFEKLVEMLEPERDLSRLPLIQAMFRVENSRMIETPELPGLGLEPVVFERGGASFELTLMLRETAGGLEGNLEYNRDLYRSESIRALVERFQTLLTAITADPQRRVATLPLLTEHERRLLTEWSGRAACASDQSLPERFRAQAAKYPDRSALVHGDTRLGYAELDRRSNHLAWRLKEQGVGPETVVGLWLDRSPNVVLAMLAVLKAGGAYLPLDPTHPRQRLAKMLGDARASVVVTQPSRMAEVRRLECGARLLELDEADDGWADAPPPVAISPDSLAYVLYTSGTTGQPKGVMMPHRSIVALVDALEQAIYRRYPGPLQVALLAALSFDASAQQIYGGLLQGHTLHLVDLETRRDPEALRDLLSAHAIDLADCTPSLLGMLAQTRVAVGPTLKHLLVGGEPLSDELLDTFRAVNPGVAITNVYGVSECGVDSTAWTLETDGAALPAIIPIGRPLTNAEIHILDAQGLPVPIGLVGELCIAGPGVGRGYLHRPDLTADRFVPHPDRPGERLYRTGDRARWNRSGEIEYLGRFDHQVKIRGHRVELGEIESRLREHPLVREAAVAVHEIVPGQRELVAYLVQDASLTVVELRAFAAQTLLDHMLPSQFLSLPALPLNPSGKLDRAALPKPTPNAASLNPGSGHVAPRDERERHLAEVWQAVLSRDGIGIHDNYFALGGDSIKALQIVTRLTERGFRLALRDLFASPTIEALAPLLRHVGKRNEEPEPLSGPAPLTAVQTAFFRGFDGAVSHFNQAVLLAPARPLSESPLRSALQAVQDHHPSLRMRFHRQDGGWRQILPADKGPVALIRVDLSAASDPEAELREDAKRRQRLLDLANGPLFLAIHYVLPDAEKLLLIAHHLLVDGVSWRILLDDLALAYGQAEAGDAIGLPAVPTSFLAWAERIRRHVDQAQQTDNPLHAERPYWRSLNDAQPPSLPLAEPATASTYRDCAVQSVALSAERTEALLTRVHGAYNTEINDLLLTALGRALCRWHGGCRTLLTLEGHGREPLFDDLDVGRTVGWFTSAFPVWLDLGEDDDLGRQIKRIKENLRQAPNKGVGYGLLNELSSNAPLWETKPLVRFNYLGQFQGEGGGLFRLLTEDCGPLVDPAARPDYPLDWVALVADGRLQLTLIYDRQRLSPEAAATLADALRRELDAVIDHARNQRETELTPSDIDYDGFDIDQLENFLDNLAAN
ncbi:MAG: amino acid adenylation domain-containing protein [Gammaproteobacteria bacterium]|nr:amino acid adenylation domain-containing protein [Gammaproteobacteria bacterium]